MTPHSSLAFTSQQKRNNPPFKIYEILLAPLYGDSHLGRLFWDNSPIPSIRHNALSVPNCSKLFQTAED